MVDWNVRIGDMLVMVSLAGAVLAFVFRSGKVSGSIDALQREVMELKTIQKEIAEVLTKVAMQQVTLNAQNQRISSLEDQIRAIVMQRFSQGHRVQDQPGSTEA